MKRYYIAKYVSGKQLFLNQQTGQFQTRKTEEVYVDEKSEALMHAAALAFPGALVYEENHEPTH